MNKRLTLIITVSVTLLLIAAFSVYAVMQNGKENEENSQNSTTTTTNGTAGEVKTGRTILVPRFDVTFALPENIDVTDIKIIYKSTDKYQAAVIASKTLEAKLDKSQCWGGTLEMGSFAEITRYATNPVGDNIQEIGGAYYRIDEGPALDNCYDASLYDKYYDPTVLRAIRETLQTQ